MSIPKAVTLISMPCGIVTSRWSASPRHFAAEHQDLARHSTYALTTRYTHSRLYDLAAAVRAADPHGAHGNGKHILAATGTDGNGQNKSLP